MSLLLNISWALGGLAGRLPRGGFISRLHSGGLIGRNVGELGSGLDGLVGRIFGGLVGWLGRGRCGGGSTSIPVNPNMATGVPIPIIPYRPHSEHGAVTRQRY